MDVIVAPQGAVDVHKARVTAAEPQAASAGAVAAARIGLRARDVRPTPPAQYRHIVGLAGQQQIARSRCAEPEAAPTTGAFSGLKVTQDGVDTSAMRVAPDDPEAAQRRQERRSASAIQASAIVTIIGIAALVFISAHEPTVANALARTWVFKPEIYRALEIGSWGLIVLGVANALQVMVRRPPK